jgi:hypothetical protein
MPEFKKSSGYRMKGFSYPGQSPLKGKKGKARKAAAKEAIAAAGEQMKEFGAMAMGSGDATNETFKVDLPSPVKENDKVGLLKKIGQGFNKATEKGIGKDIKEQAVGALVNKGLDALFTKKKPPAARKAPDMSGFSDIKFGS